MRSLLEQIAKEFPLPTEDRPKGEAGLGKWNEELVDELLDAIRDSYDFFDYEWSNHRHGWKVWCPGNEPDGWPDGESHSEPYSEINESTIIFIQNGWASLSCKHAHCCEDSKKGKKKFKDFLDYYDPDRELIDYPPDTREDWLGRHRSDKMMMDKFGVEEDLLGPEYQYALVLDVMLDRDGQKTPERIYSNDGIYWCNQKGMKIQ